jgi:hypothetical protein
MAPKLVSSIDHPASHADLNHVGQAHDVMGLSYGDLACWVTPDRQVLIHPALVRLTLRFFSRSRLRSPRG